MVHHAFIHLVVTDKFFLWGTFLWCFDLSWKDHCMRALLVLRPGGSPVRLWQYLEAWCELQVFNILQMMPNSLSYLTFPWIKNCHILQQFPCQFHSTWVWCTHPEDKCTYWKGCKMHILTKVCHLLWCNCYNAKMLPTFYVKNIFFHKVFHTKFLPSLLAGLC